MSAAINLLVFATLFLTGMAQSGSLPARPAYLGAAATAAVALVLAFLRYRKQKG